MAQGAQLAALWWPRWMGWVWVGGGPKREGIYVYIELIHFVGQQKLTQHCKITLPQLKKLLISHVWIFTNDSHKSTQKKKTSLCSNILWNPSKSYLSFGFSPQRLKSGWLYNLEKLKEVNFLKEIMRNCPVRKKGKVAQSCPTLCDPMDCSPVRPWDFPGKSTRVGCHFLLQRIFPTQGR